MAMPQSTESQYTAKDIQVLEGMEAVRKRPGMYIGSTDQRGLHHLIYELVDNAVDEAMEGNCDTIDILLNADGSVKVSDNGRGIPVDVHPTTGKSALETVLTTLHAGGKFGGSGYKVTGGLHGVGASVVNALSSWLKVDITRGGQLHSQEYARGHSTTDLITSPGESVDENTGTTITYLPDTDIFGSLEYDPEVLIQRFREMAYLNKGLLIHFRSFWRGGHERSFYFEGGIINFLHHLNRNREVLHPQPVYVQKTIEENIIEVAIQYNSGYSEASHAFANCINNTDGGTHLTGFRTALTRALNDYARKQKFLRDDQSNLTGEDVREGLTSVISVKIPDPQFEGQTKTKLGNPEIRGQVEGVVADALTAHLEEHPQDGRRIMDKCLTTARAREAARKARDLVIRKNAMEGGSLPGKLADCANNEPEASELYLVEGDSAGGSAKMGRDRRFQAILPLRGKIINVEKAQEEHMLAHEEIKALITAVGAGYHRRSSNGHFNDGDSPDEESSHEEGFDASKLRYHKVIIMTDADVDGSHIRTLLLTFFFRHMRPLINGGYLYIAQPPLYRAVRGRKSVWIYSEESKERWMDEALYGELEIFSKDRSLHIKGAELGRIVESLKVFNSGMDALTEMGLPEDVSECLIQAENFGRLDFGGKEAMQEVRAWFEQMGFPVRSLSNDQTGEYFVDVGGVELTRRILETPALQRCYQVLPKVKAVVQGKEYVAAKKGKEIAGDIPWHQLSKVLERNADKSGIVLQRYKGLGEMNPDQLWETTMDPEKRAMLQVSVEDPTGADDIFSVLMGDVVKPRADFIKAYARDVKNLDI